MFISQFILKVASRCNLNCSYCYIYNKADSTWKQRPALMSDAVFGTVLERIRQHCISTRQRYANIIFHGGEPCLIGVEKFDSWCALARQTLTGIAKTGFSIQTNGTLINHHWTEVLRKYRVRVGISLDGPPEVNDIFRVDHSGKGSYEQIRRGIRELDEGQVPHGILCVVSPGADSVAIHRHFVHDLGCRSITYVLPHFTHDNVAPIHALYGPTPCADYLIPVFDEWWFNETAEIRVGDLYNLAWIVMGGSSQIETIGNVAPHYVFIEPDGDLEGLDNLRACADGLSKTNLNVRDATFADILNANTIHGAAIFKGLPLSKKCLSCPEVENCGGGYLPHRYAGHNGFDNPSVWCADLLKLFAHVRLRLGVSIAETRERRLALQHMPEAEFAAVAN